MSIKTKTRKAYTLSTVSVTLVLFIIGVAASLLYAATLVTDSMLSNMKVSVMLQDNPSNEALGDLKNALTTNPNVSKVLFVSKAQAVEDFNKYIGEDFVLNLGENPLPASLEVYIAKNKDNTEALRSINFTISQHKNIVSEVVQQGDVMSQALKNISLFKLVIFAFLIALLFVSVITINNTIRMVVLSRRFLMRTMLLVGATRGFIRRPFMLNALWQGLASAFLAMLMLSAMFYGVRTMIPELPLPITDANFLIAMPTMLVVLGVLICLFSTLFAVNRYLKLNNDDLYIY
ncbi:MAG: permease-like cell division protein FtsX [Rikenellaceae bacterium]